MSDTLTAHPVATTLNTIAEELNEYYLERRDLIYVLLLALVSGQHAFILGTPGTGKSDVVRSFINHILNVRSFECSLSKTRSVEPILGPVDLKALRDTGDYLLKREGYLSMVELALVDEVGKMSAILGHDLLTLANERRIQEVRNGRSWHPSPLSSMFCPSNEMITGESDDAAAFWDRLPFRIKVEEIQDPGNFAKLLEGADSYIPTTTIEWPDVHKAITVDVPAVKVPQDVLMKLVAMRRDFTREHLYPSSRRWKTSVKALKAAAFLAGRDEVIEDDLHVLRFILWDTLEQIDKVERLAMSASNPFVGTVFEIRAQLAELADGITEREGALPGSPTDEEKLDLMTYGGEVNKKLGLVRDQLDTLLMEAEGRPIPGFKAVSDTHVSMLVRNYMTCLGNDHDVAEVAASKKLGSGDGGNK